MQPHEKLLYDLCEYYGVSMQEAFQLGTRSSGRKPSLPGSTTCEPVSDMTLEDIWALSPRDDQESIFKFYKDQGAWSSFRQVVRHMDLLEFHSGILNTLQLRPGMHICEYGCGVAPFMRTLVQYMPQVSETLNISLSDVDSEHFSFGIWRIKKAVDDRELNVNVVPVEISPNELPTYDKPLDVVLIFEVLEHVPSPLKCVENLTNQMSPNALLVENFIKHDDDDADDGPDLDSAKNEREEFYSFLETNFHLVGGNNWTEDSDVTRIWRKRTIKT